jgi:hypothetical protein
VGKLSKNICRNNVEWPIMLSDILIIAPYRILLPVPSETDRSCRTEEFQQETESWSSAASSLQGGNRAYRADLGKGRSLRHSRHSIVSAG